MAKTITLDQEQMIVLKNFMMRHGSEVHNNDTLKGILLKLDYNINKKQLIRKNKSEGMTPEKFSHMADIILSI